MQIKRLLFALLSKQIYFLTSIGILLLSFYFLNPEEYYIYGSVALTFLFLRNIIDSVGMQLYIKYSFDIFGSRIIAFLFLVNCIVFLSLDYTYSEYIYIFIALLLSYYLVKKFSIHVYTLNSSSRFLKYNLIISVSELASFLIFLLLRESIFFAVIIKNVSYFAIQRLLLSFAVVPGVQSNKKSGTVEFEHCLFFIFNYYSKNLDKIFVSSFFGNTAFVFYERTLAIIRMAISLFSFSIAPALLINLKEVKEERLFSHYLKYQQIFFLLGIVVIAFYTLTIDYVKQTVSNDWIGIFLYLDSLIFAIPIMLMVGNTSQFFLNESKTRLNLVSAILSFSVFIIYVVLVSYLTKDILLLVKFMYIPLFINLIQINYIYVVMVRNTGLNRYVLSVLLQAFYILGLLVWN